MKKRLKASFGVIICVMASIIVVNLIFSPAAADNNKREKNELTTKSSTIKKYNAQAVVSKQTKTCYLFCQMAQSTAEGGLLVDYLTALENAAKLEIYLKALEMARLSSQTKVARVYSASDTSNYAQGLGGVAECIRQRESGGNYSINTGNGYYGAYQFLQSTWNNTVSSMGRTDLVGVLPSSASPADQDAAFAYLYGNGSGASHWGGAC